MLRLMESPSGKLTLTVDRSWRAPGGQWCSGGFFAHPSSESKHFSDLTVVSATSEGLEKDTDRFYIPPLVTLCSGRAG